MEFAGAVGKSGARASLERGRYGRLVFPGRRANCMQPGMIGLGRMGANMARRFMPAAHHSAVCGLRPEALVAIAGDGAPIALFEKDTLVIGGGSHYRLGGYEEKADRKAGN
jgi:hypothetical protein